MQALIAARLDTLPPERKALLQDAAVLGKVFWAGALAAMGDRDPAEVEQALHELARKELVRLARTSSMEGEHEYVFWHVLVRDVCYGQIPRAARAGRHEAAAAWIEGKAGERVEDLADVLAYHYESALELSRAAGIDERAEQLQAQAVRYLAMAGARALSLDVDRAERQLSRALELSPDDDPARASLLERWAHAAQQQGRLEEAREALDRALALYREQRRSGGNRPSAYPPRLVTHRLGDPRSEEMRSPRRSSCSRHNPPGRSSSPRTPTGPDARYVHRPTPSGCSWAAERALALATQLHLPEPAFALHLHGLARGGRGGARGAAPCGRARARTGSGTRDCQ